MVEVLYGIAFAFLGLACLIASVALLLLVPALREAIVTFARQRDTREPDPSPVRRLRRLVRRLLRGGRD